MNPSDARLIQMIVMIVRNEHQIDGREANPGTPRRRRAFRTMGDGEERSLKIGSARIPVP